MTTETKLALSGGIEATAEGAGELAAVTREQSEIQSAIIAAKRFPRNEQQAFVRAINSFTRATMAENATYNFPRGGKTVEGPSVDCARELARVWGNIRYGLRVVSQDADRLHIKAYALDLETNTYVEAEDEFSKLIQRKDKYSGETKWITPDERDLRELMNRRGAIAIRNCILQVLPSDLVEDVLKTAKQTLQKDAGNALERSREEVVKALVVAFDRVGVSVQMLEAYLGHKLDLITASEVADLRAIHQSIKEGVAKREEYFRFEGVVLQETTSLTSALKAKLTEKKQAKEFSDKDSRPTEVNI
jgi:hypothetical protein